MKLRDSQFREAMDLAPDAMLLVDESGCIVFANRQVQKLLGYAPRTLVNQKIEMLLPERWRELHVQHRDTFATQRSTRTMGSGLALCALHKDGHEIPVEISLAPISTAEGFIVCAAVRDVSERQLSLRLLIEARDAADKALKANSRFLAAASHDLRQPLQTLALLGHNLKRMVREGPAVELLESHTLAVNGATRLLNKLLDISRLESGHTSVELSDHDIRELLKPLLDEFRPSIEAKGLTLAADIPSFVVCTDPTYLDQLLRNLLSNAVKFTDKGGISLRATVQGRELQLEVADTGIGIEAGKLPHIFEDFYQAERSGSRRDGYGLGLGIVQRLASLLGITLDVHSTERVGTTFTVRVPAGTSSSRVAEPAAVRDASPLPAVAVAASPSRLLLVDDDDAVRNATGLLLSLEGFTVMSAAGLGDALAQCSEHGRPDLVVSDYHLEKDVTGTQVLEQIRRLYGRDIPAIFVTGDTSQIELPRRGEALTQLLRKPVEPEILLRAIRMAVA